MDQHATDEPAVTDSPLGDDSDYEIAYRVSTLPLLVLENAAPVAIPDVLVRGQGIRRPWDI